MHDYELVLVISPLLVDEETSKLVERYTQFITGHGGTVSKVHPWGRRRMAYRIGSFQEAHYVQTNFSLDPKHIRELESDLTISEEVIRHLLVRVEPTPAIPTPASG